ncbi:hypothetical protein G6F70_008730 [Rhizopus microsporus]|nr:hypothetical protein G6F71_008690 [Rhizopus microsporus]KAG1194796.1 hypothetical protein G6F70_008730 [Rhizopus microsporus]KAG1206628.1 hypothetical protein G6F69_008691 [Rhizopus microsporus]KAG1228532.1 hypothetical protein G6F67_007755 [Rhizopus microsporus]KAG1258827.1 hypothetical protein G6F68_008529 [Rhizopus microsporus]
METIQQYIKAIVNLHAIQFSRNMTRETSVRGAALRTWLKNRRHSKRLRKRESYEDHARHTAQDGYIPEELHMMLLRGKSTRDMESCDLFPLGFKDDGFSEFPVLVLRLDHGKALKERIKYAGTIRDRDHRMCAFGALALYFFYRWHITNEGFPCFNTNMDWFNLKIFKGVDCNKSLTYTAHYAATICAFDVCSVSISGATEVQLRRHGRWNMQGMKSCYLMSLPRSLIRIINGFSSNKGDYWLARKLLTFEANLLSTVQAAKEPADNQVRRALPLASDHLQMLSAKMDANQPPQQQQQQQQSPSPTPRPALIQRLHQYQLDRNISTVVDLWRE